MRAALRAGLGVAAAASALLAAGAALADLGPKPTMAFTVTFERAGVAIRSGQLLQCQKAECSDARPLLQMGPQGFGCEASACQGRAYGFAAYARLQLSLSDGRVLKSNVFKDAGFNAKYNAHVAADALTVEPKPWWTF